MNELNTYAGFRLACRLPLCRYAAWSSLAVSELQLSAATPLWLYHRAASLPSWIEFPGGGGTDLERGYGDVRPWRPPFHASPAARKGPISSKRVSSQDPLLRKFGNFSLNSLNFHPNFSSQAPKFGNFQLTSPQIWKSSAHKPPFSEANVSSQAPHFGNPGRTPLPEKKLSAPPPPGIEFNCLWSAAVGKAARLSIYWLDAACRLVIPLRQVALAQLNKYHHQSGNAASGKLVWNQH